MAFYLDTDINELAGEYGVLLRHFASLQERCTEQARSQARVIEKLNAQILLLRAQLIIRQSAWAWEQENLDAAGSSPLQSPHVTDPIDYDKTPGLLESSLRSANLVICQTGCVSHAAFWREEDHCRRTGKTCVLVEQPDALQSAPLPRPG